VNFKGTRWYKTDLHLHTPASRCFKDEGVTPEKWVERCLEQGLEVVAVTDHNTGEYIDKIKQAAEGTNLKVFPGVELTCSESKVHMLILFDLDKTTQDIEDFLISVGINRADFASSEARSTWSTIDIAKKVEEIGGLIIPAHIDEYNGISEISYDSREKLLKEQNINAVQVVHKVFLDQNTPKDIIEQKLEEYYGRKISEDTYKNWKVSVKQALELNKTILTFSDNPASKGESKHGMWGIGQRYTWIKMDEEVSLESLRQALLLPQHRVRNDFVSKTSPYRYPANWIKTLKISNTELNSEDVIIDFNPQMTTIIGGRGTGKSSILRFIRGLFGKIADLEGLSNLKEEQEKFFKIKNNDEGVLKPESVIEINYMRYGNEYKVKATKFNKEGYPESLTISKWDEEIQGFKEIEDLDTFKLFNFDIFSQKQIYEIAQKPNALRERIDSSIYEIKELEKQLNKIKNQYLEQSAKVRRIEYSIAGKSSLISQINDKKEQISSFKESGFEELIKQYKSFNSQHAAIKDIFDQLKSKKDLIHSIKDKLDLHEIDFNLISDEHKDEIKEIISEITNEYQKAQSLIEDAYTRIEKLILQHQRNINQSGWYRDYSSIASKFEETKNHLAESGIDDLSKLEKVTKELNELEEELKNIEKLEKMVSSERESLQKLRDEFISIRRKITESRKQFLLNVIGSNGNVRIEIKPFRDKNNFENNFRRIIQKQSSYDDDIKIILNRVFRGSDVVSNVAKMIDDFNDLRNSSSDTELGEILGKRFVNIIKSLNDEQIDQLTLLLPEDEIVVKYKPNGSDSYKLLTNASAGQKTSAILTFLLSYGEIPLILDQPEDDLDNHLIYDLIVERLKRTKENRQVIVVTHNANIPVNGDSEWIICMDSEAKGMKVLANGTIEDSIIKKEICDVMEGGEDAFKLRARRYNIS
jgi:PHP family Zn ribbon phosphoesterase